MTQFSPCVLYCLRTIPIHWCRQMFRSGPQIDVCVCFSVWAESDISTGREQNALRTDVSHYSYIDMHILWIKKTFPPPHWCIYRFPFLLRTQTQLKDSASDLFTFSCFPSCSPPRPYANTFVMRWGKRIKDEREWGNQLHLTVHFYECQSEI